MTLILGLISNNIPVQHIESSVPLIVHIIFRLDIGGLENGLVNLINGIPETRYRHAVICLDSVTDFRRRLHSPNVPVVALHKKDGKDIEIYFKLWRELRRLKPDIVHTRNLGTVDMVFPAWLAGVKHRIHGEHGWDMVDLRGKSKKYRLLRRLCQPLIGQYVTVSDHLSGWLSESVGIPPKKIVTICNGVDIQRFTAHDLSVDVPSVINIGTVGRLVAVKDQMTLIRAFAAVLARYPGRRDILKLTIVGDGPLRSEIQAFISSQGLGENVRLAGKQDHVNQFLRQLDIFALPSLNEGISNTVLEAMATSLPVIASNVGGNPELVDDGKTGFLVPSSDPAAFAKAIGRYIDDPDEMRQHGQNGRQKVERSFELKIMVDRYVALYDNILLSG